MKNIIVYCLTLVAIVFISTDAFAICTKESKTIISPTGPIKVIIWHCSSSPNSNNQPITCTVQNDGKGGGGTDHAICCYSGPTFTCGDTSKEYPSMICSSDCYVNAGGLTCKTPYGSPDYGYGPGVIPVCTAAKDF